MPTRIPNQCNFLAPLTIILALFGNNLVLLEIFLSLFWRKEQESELDRVVLPDVPVGKNSPDDKFNEKKRGTHREKDDA